MASTVLSGTSNVTYTNSTGQNVRVVINFVKTTSNAFGDNGLRMSWSATGGGTVTVTSTLTSIGRNLAFYENNTNGYSIAGNNATSSSNNDGALPTEIMLAAGESFSISTINPLAIPVSAYNIVIIPEAG
jgi:hypothetical protein